MTKEEKLGLEIIEWPAVEEKVEEVVGTNQRRGLDFHMPI